MSIYNSLPNNSYKPQTEKSSLQQYDNYQIYDLYCRDTVYQVEIDGIKKPNKISQFVNFLAVQAYSPDGIPDDFDSIIRTYP